MERVIGTVSRGLRAPIIREGDDLEKIVTDVILGAEKAGEFVIGDRDVVGITESIVARVQGNYANVDQIAADIRNKFGGEEVGVIFPQICYLPERYSKRSKENHSYAQLS